MSIRYTVRTVPAADMQAEVLASQQANYEPNYDLIKRNELVRTENKRTYIRNMDDSISDFFSFTTQDLNDYIASYLAEYDFPEVDMEELNASITQQIQDEVASYVDSLDLEPPEIDQEELSATITEIANGIISEALENMQGLDGADGKSAYQYAVEGGYSGTSAQFSVQLNRVLSLVDAEEVGY